MQSGPSRELFELWAPDSRNGLIITGYSVEGTLARVSGNGYISLYLVYVYYNPPNESTFSGFLLEVV